MYAKVYQYRFASIDEAKVAASYCSENLCAKIAEYRIQSLNITIGKEGDLSILMKFEDINTLKKYEGFAEAFIKQLKNTFAFKENQYAGVFVYNYEGEASSKEIKV